MAALKEFLKTTIIGGLMFLVPVILIVVILGHAMRLAAKIAVPIAEKFATTQVAGVAVVTIVAVLVLLILSFLAGLVARTGSVAGSHVGSRNRCSAACRNIG